MASRPWTSDELAELQSGLGRGAKASDIARRLSGRSLKAVKVRMARLRSGRPPSGRGKAAEGYWDGRRADADDMERFNAKTAAASKALLGAIERAGLRP